ncbi:MAG: hypothetical protein EOO41_04625, partial [Methanobacteriota archaeon]
MWPFLHGRLSVFRHIPGCAPHDFHSFVADSMRQLRLVANDAVQLTSATASCIDRATMAVTPAVSAMHDKSQTPRAGQLEPSLASAPWIAQPVGFHPYWQLPNSISGDGLPLPQPPLATCEAVFDLDAVGDADDCHAHTLESTCDAAAREAATRALSVLNEQVLHQYEEARGLLLRCTSSDPPRWCILSSGHAALDHAHRMCTDSHDAAPHVADASAQVCSDALLAWGIRRYGCWRPKQQGWRVRHASPQERNALAVCDQMLRPWPVACAMLCSRVMPSKPAAALRMRIYMCDRAQRQHQARAAAATAVQQSDS